MAFVAGDAVHVRTLGTGVVREVRNGGRYLVDIKGRALVVGVDQLAPAPTEKRRHVAAAAGVDPREPDDHTAVAAGRSLDLHGRSVHEALEAVDLFLNDLLLEGEAHARIIHGRSGGRLKAAVHTRLAQLPAVRRFRLDPANPGVTIVSF